MMKISLFIVLVSSYVDMLLFWMFGGCIGVGESCLKFDTKYIFCIN